MAKSFETTRITAFVEADLMEKLNELTTEIGISKDKLLRSTLNSELDELEKMPANGPKAKSWNEAINNVLKNRKKRLNLTLEKKVALRMQQLCEKKGITRDQFINEYVDFLVNGAKNGSCIGPLEKIAVLMCNLRVEYNSDNSDSSEGKKDTAYDDLHLSEEDARYLINELIGKSEAITKEK